MKRDMDIHQQPASDSSAISKQWKVKLKNIAAKWWWVALVVPILVLAGFVTWAQTPLGPMPEALAALESDDLVRVEIEPWLVFQPTQSAPDTGFILYPGGRVDYRSYSPAARAIAAQGYLVVIPRMPLNLAVFSPDAAEEIIPAYPQIEFWAIGGHSLGGSMAANYAYRNPTEIAGLILWASYPASGDDLSNFGFPVASIYATLDGLATIEEVLASRPLLPSDTTWAAIEGGNHAQFGWYGEQPGDNTASISREEQQTQVIEASLDLLRIFANRDESGSR